MISRRATDTATQFCMTAAASASPIHKAEANQIFSIPNPFSLARASACKIETINARDPQRGPASAENLAQGGQQKTRLAAGYTVTLPRVLTRQESSALSGG